MDLSTYIHLEAPHPPKRQIQSFCSFFFEKWPTPSPEEIAVTLNSWFINKPPADPSFLGGLDPSDFPMEFPPGDPLAIYQTLDRWFGNCIPHDAMNEHGIVTWVVLGGRAATKKVIVYFKRHGRKMPKKVFEPLKLKNGRTESKVSIGFFSIQFQSEAQCVNLKKKHPRHLTSTFTPFKAELWRARHLENKIVVSP